jgi:CRP-like cAMP-binding protein
MAARAAYPKTARPGARCGEVRRREGAVKNGLPRRTTSIRADVLRSLGWISAGGRWNQPSPFPSFLVIPFQPPS